MAMRESIMVLEQYMVTPPPGTNPATISLPLTFFDMVWIFSSPVESVVFYELPLSRSHFVDNYIPKLKDSLSSTLKDYQPLAGYLIIPSDSRNPEIRCTDGEGVTVIFAESCHNNFKHLTANYPRNSCDFRPLVPQLPLPSSSSDSLLRVVPVMALQVTLFPEAGICMGLSNHHAVGDVSAITGFLKAWALNSKLGDEATSLLEDDSRPFYDRSVIKDPKGIGSLLWNQFRSLNQDSTGGYIQPPSDTNKIRQTFFLGPKDIQKLKNLVYTKRPTVKHLSSFTITCSYVWTCLLKCDRSSGKLADEEDFKNFIFPVDCRGRVDPPIPSNYFGNCLSFCLLKAKQDELVGDDGFLVAVEIFAEIIHQKLRNKGEVLEDADTWATTLSNMDWGRTLSVAGTPRHNYYHLDFGWGKAIKYECTSIDHTGAISLSGCRDSEGGMEIGVSLPRAKLDAFASAFNEVFATLKNCGNKS